MSRFLTRITVLLVLSLLSACASVPRTNSQFIAAAVAPVQREVIQIETVRPEVAVDIALPEISPSNPTLQMRANVRMTAAEVRCLATNIYFEARGEPEIGQTAVAYVVLNRMADSRFPNTACGVTHHKYKGSCQFSWVCDRNSNVPRNKEQYDRAERIALAVMQGEIENPIGGSLFFHATSVNKSKAYAGEFRIHGHRFYGAVRHANIVARL